MGEKYAIATDKTITIAKLEAQVDIAHTTLKKFLQEMQNIDKVRVNVDLIC